MSAKVVFKNSYSNVIKLLVVLIDDSLKLYGDIQQIDKKNKGIVSKTIKAKSFTGKSKEKLSFLGLNAGNIEEIILSIISFNKTPTRIIIPFFNYTCLHRYIIF